MTDAIPDFDLSQFLDLFIEEAQRHVQTLNQCVLTLERTPDDAEAVETMFRAAHSLKGNSATMGYNNIATLAHAAEDALHKVRDGEWSLTPELVDILFAANDGIQMLMNDVAAGGMGDADIRSTLERLRSYSPADRRPTTDDRRPATDDLRPATDDWRPMTGDRRPATGRPATDDRPTDDRRPVTDNRRPATGRPATIDQPAADPSTSLTPSRCPSGRTGRRPAAIRPTAAATMIRVDVRHLDDLLNVVIEMVIHRSVLTRLVQRYDLPHLNDALVIHNRLLAQLQDAVLKMRMVPVAHVFDRFPRMVRDILKRGGKEAQLIIDGGDVELDRTALEALGDPLLHLLRNAADHGLETPAERQAAGKPTSGTLRLSARRERDMVVIEVGDDGRGMDSRRIASASVKLGIVTPESLAEMNDAQILELICHPGFTLRKTVTSISGRGVGMGVVKKEVEALRGSLEIETYLGQGSTFRIKLPVMLALVNAMLVRVGNEQYAIPATQVERIIELDTARIEYIGIQRVIRLDKGVLPLRRLSDLLHIPEADSDPRYALIVQHDGKTSGLEVDMILGHEEIVVKPLPAALRGIPGLTGVSILGEGETVLILDSKEVGRITAG